MRIHLLDLNAGEANRGTPALLDLFARHGCEVSCYEVRLAGELPMDDTGIWVLGGGPGSPLDGGHWREPLLQRLRHRLGRQRPTLGICFGFEILALALGARVRSLARGRGDIFPLTLADGAGTWSHLTGASVYEKRDFGVFEVPHAGAEVLAFGPEGDVAALRIGTSVLGVIFHPEADLGPPTRLVFESVLPAFLMQHREGT